MALLPGRFIGPMRAVEPLHSRVGSSSASHVGGSSLCLLFNANRCNYSANVCCSHFVACSGSEVYEVEEEEGFKNSSQWQRRQRTPGATRDSPYRQRTGAPRKELPWDGAPTKELPWNLPSGPPSADGHSRFKQAPPWESQRPSFHESDDKSASTSRRRNGREAPAGRQSSAGSNGNYSYRSSRPAPSDNGRNMHRAPWEQGRSRAGSVNSGVSRSPPVLRDEEQEFGMEDTEDAEVDSKHFDGRGEKSAMSRIVDKLREIQKNNPALQPRTDRVNLQQKRSLTSNSVFLPRPGHPVFPALGKGWSSPDHPVPKPASPEVVKEAVDARFPWERGDDDGDLEDDLIEKKKKVKPPSMAELTIPEDELKRLRALGLMVRQRLKIGRLGVTPGIVEALHNGWRTCEIVKVKCDGPPALNMKRTHEELEKRSGGLVIWRSGSAAVVYRGKDYVPPAVRLAQEKEEEERKKLMSLHEDKEKDTTEIVPTETQTVNSSAGPASRETEGAAADETEFDAIEDILEGLGPRYADWTGNKPVPVDGDLLLGPNAVFKRPFRLLPYGIKPKLSNFEMTDLRHLARPLAPHFVLGRNRGLSGLAAAIVKLWEKSEVVKIGVKRGVQNTNNERMAEELKRLTGGTLLARDKEFIVLYRGKDFLPPAVQAALEERDAMSKALQEEEERVRMASRSNVVQLADAPVETSTVGTLAETLEAKATWEVWQNSEEQHKNRLEARKAARFAAAHRIERKVNLATQKKARAEMELAKLEKLFRPTGPPVDREHLTDEEKYMFRKLGLRMKAFLLLGRRGIFDGVVENMHLHWKHRELVKILAKGHNSIEVEKTAKMLEIESGGILVGIVTTSKGPAIIVYRGKNYQRPPELRPRHLLTKRQALKRSLEMQRKQALEKHILALEQEIGKMRVGLDKMEEEDKIAESSGEALAESDDDLSMKASPAFTEMVTKEDDEESDDLDIESAFSLSMGSSEGGRMTLDPIFRAAPLTRKERLLLRHQALKLGKTAHFNVGKSNVVAGLAKSIRLYFQKHALVKVGVKGRAKGTPVAEIVEQLEDATGGVLVSTEPSKLILYRGWADGEKRPDLDSMDDEDISPELLAAMRSEDEIMQGNDHSYLTEAEAKLLGKDEGEEGEEEESEEEEDWGVDAWNEDEWEEDDETEEEDEEGNEIEGEGSGQGGETASQWDEDDTFGSGEESEGEEDRKGEEGTVQLSATLAGGGELPSNEKWIDRHVVIEEYQEEKTELVMEVAPKAL